VYVYACILCIDAYTHVHAYTHIDPGCRILYDIYNIYDNYMIC
jgi:hypothetical protein